MKNDDEPPIISGTESPQSIVTSVCSARSDNLIMCSIREAVVAMNEKAKRMKANGTNPYERAL